jgi:acyl-CoA reductase-like NAD-dependent aldehyde dehydrogenase
VKKLTVGETTNKENVLGPVINDRAAERIKRHFDDAQREGRQVARGRRYQWPLRDADRISPT